MSHVLRAGVRAAGVPVNTERHNIPQGRPGGRQGAADLRPPRPAQHVRPHGAAGRRSCSIPCVRLPISIANLTTVLQSCRNDLVCRLRSTGHTQTRSRPVGNPHILHSYLAALLPRHDAADATADGDADGADSGEAAPAKSLMERQEDERHRKQEALVSKSHAGAGLYRRKVSCCAAG